MSSTRNFNIRQQKITLARRIVQIGAFFFINYVLIELIFSINLISLEGTVKVLPILNSPRNPISKGTGFLEFILYSLAEGTFPYLLIAILILVVLFTGRFFCGWICPIGTIQDGLSALTSNHKKVNIDTHKALLKLKYFIVILITVIIGALGLSQSTNIIFYFELKQNLGVIAQRPISFFSLSEYVFVFFPDMIIQMVESGGIAPLFSNFWIFFMFIFYLILMIAAIWYPRAYCRYFCPYGAVCSAISDFSFLKLSRSPVKCVGRADCGICERVCPKQIRILDEPFEFFTGGGECNLCLKCKQDCPHDAINIKFG